MEATCTPLEGATAYYVYLSTDEDGAGAGELLDDFGAAVPSMSAEVDRSFTTPSPTVAISTSPSTKLLGTCKSAMVIVISAVIMLPGLFR